MARWETLMARDGHEFAAYLAPAYDDAPTEVATGAPPAARRGGPSPPPRGAVVILQEIFGVNEHIRSLVRQYAAAGFVAIAPALFDRIGRNIELGYSPLEVEQARGYKLQADQTKALLDIAAAVNVVRHVGKVALIGYCWGGMLSWVGAGRLPVQAAVGYYASRVWEQLDRLPACPVLLHFGDRDANIPRAEIDRVRAAYPEGQYYFYAADHGFNCSARASYDAPSAALAWQRTQDFLKTYLG